jgi:ATPase subunit of ABC transporter with duplicated ATPase domains
MNGAGKSTLLRIIAGEDQDFDGESLRCHVIAHIH